jgi:hypothetical protein
VLRAGSVGRSGFNSCRPLNFQFVADVNGEAVSGTEAATAEVGRPGLIKRSYRAVKFPPPTEAKVFTRRKDGLAYIGAWCLTAAHLIIWVLIAIGVFNGLKYTIGDAVLSFVSTCLLIWMVIVIHRRFQINRGNLSRHVLSAWWRGPWDSVGRQIWLPVRLGAAWDVVRHPVEPDLISTPSSVDI